VRTLDDLLKVKELGVTRIGATATAAMLDEARKRFGDGSEANPSRTFGETPGY